MSKILNKRSKTTMEIPSRHKITHMSPKEHDNALRYFRAHLKNRTYQVFPQPDFKDICLAPVIQPIIQPKISNDDLTHKRLVKKANFFYLSKTNSNASISEKNQANSFVLDESTLISNSSRKLQNDLKSSTKDFEEKMKYFTKSMILNAQSVMPIELNENNRNFPQTDRRLNSSRLPYITPNRFDDVLMPNKPSYLNNYRQSGTNHNTFRKTSKNFNVSTYAPRVWLRSKYMTNPTWVKQSEFG